MTEKESILELKTIVDEFGELLSNWYLRHGRTRYTEGFVGAIITLIQTLQPSLNMAIKVYQGLDKAPVDSKGDKLS